MPNKPTTDELTRAMGAFCIAFGASMPKKLAQRIAANLTEMAPQMQRNGDTNVGKLCEGFASALLSPHTSAEKIDVH
jgi:hypothetical protein